MRKIPTVFERDWEGDRSRVLDRVHADCGWVLAGEGVATRKLDGTCCAVIGGHLYKRLELRGVAPAPVGFIEVGHDDETGKTVGWVPVDPGEPANKWHVEAWRFLEDTASAVEGTYELLGPKVQGNPERWAVHQLVAHGSVLLEEDPPRSFEALKAWLDGKDIEGIVWRHPDGRMAKVKLRDFGLKRVRTASS